MQQMMERMLAKMGANQAEMKATQQKIDINQAMEDANMRETKDYIKTDPNPVIISHDHKT
jgi:hypothetical protein